MIPRATYRFQFNRDFPFARAEALVPFLDRLSISHIYASPITKARAGSMHGYDVVDPTCVNPELGGEEALRELVAALRRRDMGLIVDIVPNHMGVAGGENRWWNDVLQYGRDSRYAGFFDIDRWHDERLLLPILGAPLGEVLAAGDIALDRSRAEPMLAVYGEHHLPLSPQSREWLDREGEGAPLEEILARQHYRLGWWRSADDELNWRRFFTINELAGLRVEDEAVFEESHALYFRLWREGLIDGVRIDHVDGLTDPAAYCRRLRARFDAIDRAGDAPAGPAYIVVEKILGPGETLREDWSVDGTSGYDFMEEVSLLLHDPAGEAALSELWRDFSGRELTFEAEELQARQDMLSWAFDGQLQRCVRAFVALAASAPETQALTAAMLRRAIARLLWVFPVYRTYGTGGDAPAADAAVRDHARAEAARFTPPGEAEMVDHVLGWLAGEGPGDAALAADAVRQFQQLSAPIAAKAVEDTAFYRYGRLLSRTDVGFDAARLAGELEDFHQACRHRREHFPHGMLATATHDHKRGEDVRARLAALSSIPQIWGERVREWDVLADGAASGVHPAGRYALYQMMLGAWPDGLNPTDADGLGEYANRLGNWQEKAVREAKLRSSWKAADQDYEQRCRRFVEALAPKAGAPSPLAEAVHRLVGELAGATQANILVQAGLRNCVPGMPDLYQGTELHDFSMVDPDNRRPVDYAKRQAMLEDGAQKPAKLALIAHALKLRRRHPALFSQGDYRPARVVGPRAGHVLAFSRISGSLRLDCAFAVRCAEPLFGGGSPVPGAQWWEGTEVRFASSAAPAADLFAVAPWHIELHEGGGAE